jgi:hypothetical protein
MPVALLVGLLVSTLPATPASAAIHVRDVGGDIPALRTESSSFFATSRDVNHDGWPDLLISRHGQPAVLLLNHHDVTTSSGFRVEAIFRDTIHFKPDRHGCAIADVDQDGLDDIFCAKGAHQGYDKKWNELWIQHLDGTWVDEAHDYGVEDVWGRGRFPAFLDLNGDAYPDLFIGNDAPRRDEHVSPNRTFVNDHGIRFEEVRLGVTHEVGDSCTQAVDYNRDGREDLLVCGNHAIYLYRQTVARRFVRAGPRRGVPPDPAQAAKLADVTGEGRPDLLIVRNRWFLVLAQKQDHSFSDPIFVHRLVWGHGLVLADVNDDGDTDVLVVQGCKDGVNVPDALLINRDRGRRFGRIPFPQASIGCGDTGVGIDFDLDGRGDLLVLNGGGENQNLHAKGPEQLLTSGDWQPAS